MCWLLGSYCDLDSSHWRHQDVSIAC